MESTAILFIALSSLLTSGVRGAFTAAGTNSFTASSSSKTMSMAAGAVASTFTERPFKMTSALVPPAQLRMRPTNNLNNIVASSSSQHYNGHGNGKRSTSRRQYPQPSQIEMSTATLPQQHSKTTNYYYPWSQRRSSHRAVTSLHAHSKEKSSYAEDNALDFDTNEEELLVDSEMEDASLHRMEKGSDTTTDIQYSLTTTTSTIDSSSSTELWGMPVQSVFLLNLVAVIWGTQHAVVKSVVDDSTIGIGAGFMKWIDTMGLHVGTLQSTVASGEVVATAASVGGDDSAAAYFTLARFGLAALLASPFTPGLDIVKEKLGFGESTTPSPQNDQSKQSGGDATASAISHSNANTVDNRDESLVLAWKYGAELGLYMFLGYAFQAIGLETTTASRSGFLLYLNVKFVPFLSYFLFGKTIMRTTWISAFVAFGGTALLAFDNANAAGSTENGLAMAFNVGDLWCIAAAAASALFILRMEAASKAVPKSSELNAATLWTVAVLSLLWTMGISWNSGMGEASAEASAAFVQAMQQTFQQTISTITAHPLSLIYLSGVTTALANFLQSKAQKDVSAERASVIYAMDPVYGAIFANILLGETLGGLGLVGAFLILVAAATNAFLDFGSVNDKEAVVVSNGGDTEKR